MPLLNTRASIAGRWDLALLIVFGMILSVETYVIVVQQRAIDQLSRSVITEKALSTINAERAKVEQSITKLEEATDVQPSAKRGIGGVGGGRHSPTELERLKAYESIKASPPYQRLQHLTKLVANKSKYGPLIKILGLEGDKQNRVLDLLTDAAELDNDINDTMAAQRVASGKDSHTNSLSMAREAKKLGGSEIASDIRSLIGLDGLNQLKDYEKNIDLYLVIAQIELGVAETGATPLTAPQLQKVKEILANSSKAPVPPLLALLPNGERAQLIAGAFGMVVVSAGHPYVHEDGSVEVNLDISDEDMKLASGILTPDQMGTLNAMHSKISSQRKLTQILGIGP